MHTLIEPENSAFQMCVVLDARVLFGGALRDLILRIGKAKICELCLTDQILEEVRRNLIEKGQVPEERGQYIVSRIRECFQLSIITNHIPLLSAESVNELVAAEASHSPVIVAQNLEDFPQSLLEPSGIKAWSIDDFLVRLFERKKIDMMEIVRNHASNFKNPPLTIQEALEKLKKHVPNFVQLVLNELAR